MEYTATSVPQRLTANKGDRYIVPSKTNVPVPPVWVIPELPLRFLLSVFLYQDK
jgi:hypothetical protein